MYLKGSPYHDAEGSSHIISCLNDAIINYAPRIGGKLTTWNCIHSFHLEGWRTHTWDRVGKIRMCIICDEHYAYIESWEGNNGYYGNSLGNLWWCLCIHLHGLFLCFKIIYTTCIRLWQSFFTIIEEWMLWCNNWS